MQRVYSTSPQAVSRYLSSLGWERSRTLRGRIANDHTQGFTVKDFLGETQVTWSEDSRTYGAGHREATHSMPERLRLLAVSLGKRYEVAQRGEVLIVSAQSE